MFSRGINTPNNSDTVSVEVLCFRSTLTLGCEKLHVYSCCIPVMIPRERHNKNDNTMDDLINLWLQHLRKIVTGRRPANSKWFWLCQSEQIPTSILFINQMSVPSLPCAYTCFRPWDVFSFLIIGLINSFIAGLEINLMRQTGGRLLLQQRPRTPRSVFRGQRTVTLDYPTWGKLVAADLANSERDDIEHMKHCALLTRYFM